MVSAAYLTCLYDDVLSVANTSVLLSSCLPAGGFLAGHCIGQHPELFKVAAMRNPCTNIASMVTATDIPDWCYVETLGPG